MSHFVESTEKKILVNSIFINAAFEIPHVLSGSGEEKNSGQECRPVVENV